MAKIYVSKNREPFDVPRGEAEEIKKYWMDETIPRNKKITFSYFTGTLGDIKSFDMRTEHSVSNETNKIEYELPTPELRVKQAELLKKYRPVWLDEAKTT